MPAPIEDLFVFNKTLSITSWRSSSHSDPWKAKDSALNFYNSMRESYVHDLYYSTQGESYDTWRALADELLEKLSLYATKPEECYRMIQNKPIESEYKPADK